MISDEKMLHVLHLMIEGLEKEGYASYPSKEKALHEAKIACFNHIKSLNEVAENARKRILSQKNPPPEFSPQFETLYRKYYEEEIRKKGG